MEVVCGRCKADYEFDDALISARGTVVRCTNCGLQFKVFPSGGEAPPEEWSVLNEEGGVLATYATLPDLQRAIGLGEINGDDLLVRGDERPRPLSEILELAPLLRQGASYRPPPAVEHSPNLPDGRSFAKTTIGLPTFDQMGGLARENSPPVPTPPAAMPAGPADGMRPRRGSAPPKIRSALSGPFLGVKVAPEPAPGTLPSGSPPHPLSRAHLPSLSATLASPVPPAPAARDQGAHDPQTQRRSPASSEVPPLEPDFRAAARASHDSLQGTQLSASPGSSSSRSRSEAPPPLPRGGAPDANITESTESGSLESGARSPEPPRRMARGALFVIAIGAGAVLFAATLGREQLSRLKAHPSSVPPTIAREPQGETSSGQGRPVSAGELALRVEALDVEWWRARLNGEREVPSLVAERVNEVLGRVDAAMATSEGAMRSEFVVLRASLLRMAGRVSDARHVIAEIGTSAAKYPYILATLDLAEAGLGADLNERARLSMSARVRSGLVRSSQSAEPLPEGLGKSPFLAETAVIYALVSDGKVDQARVELGHLGELAKGQPWPLERELERFVASEELGKVQALAMDAGQLQDAPNDKLEGGSARAVSQKQAPEQMQAWAKEADALWSAGDQKAAVVLYQKVKRGLGTKHFLGQRAAARIQQANREGASR